jgi:hypothetical protein
MCFVVIASLIIFLVHEGLFSPVCIFDRTFLAILWFVNWVSYPKKGHKLMVKNAMSSDVTWAANVSEGFAATILR